MNQLPNRGINFTLLAGAISSFLLALSHRTDTWYGWASVALVPVLMATRDKGASGSTMLAATITGLGPCLLMFESILSVTALGFLLAVLTQIPQVLIPICIWAYYSKNRNFWTASIGFLLAWTIIEIVRSNPILNGYYASFYSLSYTQAPTSILIGTFHFPTWTVSCCLLAINVWLSIMLLLRFPYVQSTIHIGTAAILVTIIGLELRIAEPMEAIDEHINLIQTGFTPAEHTVLSGELGSLPHFSAELAAYLRALPLEYKHTILLPETVFRGLHSIRDFARYFPQDHPLILAGASLETPSSATNSVVSIDGHDLNILFDKWQLVPLFETRIFSAGNYISIMDLPGGTRLAVAICMDATLPWMIDKSVRAGANAIFVASATDYGRGYYTPEMQLHLARHHAARFSTPIYFASTNGPSAVISRTGRIVSQIPQGQQGVLTTADGAIE